MKSRPSRQLSLQLDAEGENLVDLGADEIARQAILRHALVQHAADDRRRVEERDAVAEQRQVVGAAQTGRARRRRRRCARRRRPCGSRGRAVRAARDAAPAQRVLHAVALGHRALQRANRDGLVDQASPALRLARVGADAPADRGERVRRARDRVAARRVPLGRWPVRSRRRSCGRDRRSGTAPGPGSTGNRARRRSRAVRSWPAYSVSEPGRSRPMLACLPPPSPASAAP